MKTTFTVLVTLKHDVGQGHSPSRVAEIIKCAMEEGTSCSRAFSSAQVDAFMGEHLSNIRMTASQRKGLSRALPLHGGPYPADQS